MTSETPVEQTVRLPSGVQICYDELGDRHDPTLLLIMGLAGPLIWWDLALCRSLAATGLHVVRFDNRDIGRSSYLDEQPVTRQQVISAFLSRGRARAPYTMSDLATDASGVLDAVGVESAHVLGASMGGMIAQTLATEHPERVRSLTSIMSTTGARKVGWQDPRLLPLLAAAAVHDEAGYVTQSLKVASLIGSPDFPFDETAQRAVAAATYRRGLSATGVRRQMLAVILQPDRTEALHGFDAPALVVHGLRDKMVHVSGGLATAAAIPGAELMLVPGMGHDLPRPVWPALLAGVHRLVRRAEAG
jgi:pimeloyl-ACP methyl ester carboxylesterase